MSDETNNISSLSSEEPSDVTREKLSKTVIDSESCKKVVSQLFTRTDIKALRPKVTSQLFQETTAQNPTLGRLSKTLLDPESCKTIVSGILSRAQIKAHEQRVLPAPTEILSNERFRVASPCSASWDSMVGKGRVRFCNTCKSQVYDLNNLDKKEIEALIFQREGQQKGLLYKRTDGKFLTSDCPIGAATRRNLAISIAAVAFIVLGLACLLLFNPPPNQPPAPPAANIKSTTVKDSSSLHMPAKPNTGSYQAAQGARFVLPAATQNGTGILQSHFLTKEPPPRFPFPPQPTDKATPRR